MSVHVVEPESVGVSSEYLAHVDELVARHLREDAYQGMVVLMARHGKICYFKAFGNADDDVPMQRDSIFRLASMSKVPSAAAVLQLWDRGLISLADPIATYLPEFSQMYVAREGANGEDTLVPATNPITIHHLLSMTAGLTNSWWYDEQSDKYAYRTVPKYYAEGGVPDDFQVTDTNLEEKVKLLARQPLMANPGEVFDYSNNSVDTFCRLVEVVSGMDFDTYLRTNIFEPLGMKEIWFYPPEEVQDRVAAVYWGGTKEKQLEDFPLGLGKMGVNYGFGGAKRFFSGAGGLHATTHDYYRFAQMLLNGGELDGVRILSRAAVDLMTHNEIGDLTNWQLTQNKWGYQLDIQDGVNAPAGSPAYLGGAGAYGWQGFFSTKFVNNPANDTVIMTMTTPGFDGALPHNLLLVAAANAAVID